MSEHKSDRVNELYKGEILDQKNQEVCRQRINWLCSQVEGERVLDYGCSQGIASLILGREGFKVTGIDVDSTVIDYAKAELELETDYVKQCVDFQLVNARHLEFDDETFDCVLFGEVIEHLARPEANLKEIRRVLKPGGRLIITTPFGVLPHPDHMHTYYLSNFVETIGQYFAIESLHVLEKYICCLGLAADEPTTSLEAANPDYLLKHSEEAFERAEWAYIDWRQKLRKQYHLRAKEVEKQQAKVQQLDSKVKELAGQHKNEIESIRAEHNRQIQELEQRYQEQARRCQEQIRLEIQQLRKSKAKYHSAQRITEMLRGRLSRQKDQLEYFRAELKLRESEVRYRLGDALVRTYYHPAEIFCLPGRTFNLFFEGMRRRSERRKSDQAETMLLAAGSATTDRKLGVGSAANGGAARSDGALSAATLDAPGPVEPDAKQKTQAGDRQGLPEISFTPAARPNLAPRLPLKVGVIMDEFTIECFRDECELITFAQDNWKQVLAAQRPEFLFVESTWKGNDGAWRYRVNRTSTKRMIRFRLWYNGVAHKTSQPCSGIRKIRPISTASWPRRVCSITSSRPMRIVSRTIVSGSITIGFMPCRSRPNPAFTIRSTVKKSDSAICASRGTYHREKYPQRQRDLETLLTPAKTRGLTIFDRQHGYGQEDRYSFPPEYHEFVRGGLPYMEMVQAYKAYEVFLNINSVRESPTMFSRRVLELLACGTPVISTPSAGNGATAGAR